MAIDTMIITGASRGVGKALTTRFAAEGTRVCAIARSEAVLEALAARYPENIHCYAADISRAQQVRDVFAAIESEHGPVDVLINCAAVFQMRLFIDQDLETIDRLIDTNLKGTMYCTRLVLPSMIKRKQGRIINIASVAGTRGIPEQAIYCASKHGVVGFGDALAQELLCYGILLVTLCPGGIDTPLWRSGETEYPGDLAQLMQPEEIVDLVAFILSQPRGTLYKKLIFFPTNEWH